MQPLVGVIMGSKSDWETMQHTVETLMALEAPHEVRIVSAHRTPDLLFQYASEAEARGLEEHSTGCVPPVRAKGRRCSATNWRMGRATADSCNSRKPGASAGPLWRRAYRHGTGQPSKRHSASASGANGATVRAGNPFLALRRLISAQ